MTVSDGRHHLTLLHLTLLHGLLTEGAEPGYYADGRFGIRIENVVVVREANTPNNFGDKGYLKFEHVTMVGYSTESCLDWLKAVLQCPIQKNLIDTSLMSPKEKSWLNAYHAEVSKKLSPLLQNDKRALEWLQRECSPL